MLEILNDVLKAANSVATGCCVMKFTVIKHGALFQISATVRLDG